MLNADYFKRIDALNYTMMHDDGQIPDDLETADIILLGVSRTSKTPTSIYLANRGIKTANILWFLECLFPLACKMSENHWLLVYLPHRIGLCRSGKIGFWPSMQPRIRLMSTGNPSLMRSAGRDAYSLTKAGPSSMCRGVR